MARPSFRTDAKASKTFDQIRLGPNASLFNACSRVFAMGFAVREAELGEYMPVSAELERLRVTAPYAYGDFKTRNAGAYTDETRALALVRSRREWCDSTSVEDDKRRADEANELQRVERRRVWAERRAAEIVEERRRAALAAIILTCEAEYDRTIEPPKGQALEPEPPPPTPEEAHQIMREVFGDKGPKPAKAPRAKN